jgi:hypothetical protein
VIIEAVNGDQMDALAAITLKLNPAVGALK